MTFSSNKLLSSINRTGVAKSSQYEVQITGDGSSLIEAEMMFRADAAELPGRTISTNDYRIYGPIRKIAYAATYTDTTVSILCSRDLREKHYFEGWHDRIVNSKGKSHNLGYYDDYAKNRNLEVRTFDETGTLTTRHIFNEAYPIGVAPIAVSWASDDLIKLNVTFAFRDYDMQLLTIGGQLAAAVDLENLKNLPIPQEAREVLNNPDVRKVTNVILKDILS